MSPLTRTTSWILAGILPAAFCFAAAPPASQPARTDPRLLAVRTAQGPWKQVAAIESFAERGGPFPAEPGKPPPRMRNPNVFAFLDAQRLAVADGEHPIRIISAATGQVLLSFGDPLPPEGGSATRRLVATADGRYMVIVPAPSPTVWDTRSGKAVAVLPEVGAAYFAAAFTPDGRQLALLRSPPPGKGLNNVLLTVPLGENGRRNEWPAPRNARSLATAGDFIALEDDAGVRIYAADTLEVLFDTSGDIRQTLVSLDVDDRSATLTTLHLGQTAPTLSARWKQFNPALTRYALPGGAATPLEKFAFPETEPNDHRFQAQYATSPDRRVFAASREGRVDFYRLSDGALFRSIPLGYPAHHPQMQFLSAQRVLLHTHFETDGINEFDLPTGQKLATIPDSEPGIVASPDGRRFAVRRNRIPAGDGSFREFPHTAIIVWERTP